MFRWQKGNVVFGILKKLKIFLNFFNVKKIKNFYFAFLIFVKINLIYESFLPLQQKSQGLARGKNL
jgi:hypothetical protein